MRAHPIARLAAAAAGLAVALSADGPETLLCAAVTTGGFVLAGEMRAGLRMICVAAPMFAIVTLLWLLVLWEAGSPAATFRVLVEPGARILLLARALVGSSAMILGLGTTPDGELYLLLRQLRAPRIAAVAVASGAAMAGGIADALGQALTAMRANGLVGHSLASRLIGLGEVVAMSWVSSLSVAMNRAECKWQGNRFLDRLDPPLVRAGREEVWGTVVLAATSALLVATLVAGTYVDYLL